MPARPKKHVGCEYYSRPMTSQRIKYSQLYTYKKYSELQTEVNLNETELLRKLSQLENLL